MTGRWRVFGAATCALCAPCDGQETVFEGSVVAALLLADGAVAVAERTRLLFVRPGERTDTAGRSFGVATRIARTADGGVAVWDDSSSTAFVFDAEGRENRPVPLPDPGIGIGYQDPRFVALLANDARPFEEGVSGNPLALSSTPYRTRVRYATVARDDTRNVVWEGPAR